MNYRIKINYYKCNRAHGSQKGLTH
jgi:hypothetical protein